MAALLLEKEPNLTPAQLLADLKDFADENSVPIIQTPDNKFGFGKVDASFIVTGEKFQGTLTDFGKTKQDIPPIQQEDLFEDNTPTNLIIPQWIKQNAAWWADGQIDDASFLSGIEYLVQNEVIVIPDQNKYLTLNSDQFVKPYSRTEKTEINISGFVEDFHQGSYVFMDIIKPDGTIEEQKLVGAKGNFFTTYYLTRESPTGVYKINIKYQDIQVDTKEFEVTDDQEEKIVEDRVDPQVPQWIRNNADWWAKGLISDQEFASGIKFLIEEEILIV